MTHVHPKVAYKPKEQSNEIKQACTCLYTIVRHDIVHAYEVVYTYEDPNLVHAYELVLKGLRPHKKPIQCKQQALK